MKQIRPTSFFFKLYEKLYYPFYFIIWILADIGFNDIEADCDGTKVYILCDI